jgi:hypothetical protein
MKKFFQGIGKRVIGVIGWILGVAIILSILALIVFGGLAVLGIIAALVIVGLIVGGIRKLFGIKSVSRTV